MFHGTSQDAQNICAVAKGGTVLNTDSTAMTDTDLLQGKWLILATEREPIYSLDASLFRLCMGILDERAALSTDVPVVL